MKPTTRRVPVRTPGDKPLLRLLIVDDHAVVRDGLEAMLKLTLAPVQIGTAASAAHALRLCGAFVPEIVLLDVRMPGGDGFGAIESILQCLPEARILLLSASATDAEVRLARRLGASGYLSKSAEGSEVVEAIRKVREGGTWFRSSVTNEDTRPLPLSARELDVLRHLGRGLSNHELGRALGISETTVKAHLRSVFVKLEAGDRAEAVARAYQLGILSVENT